MVEDVQNWYGSILGGSQLVESSPAEPTGESLAWQFELLWVERFPDLGLESLAANLRVIAHPEEATPIQGAPLLVVGARFAKAEAVEEAWGQLLEGAGGRTGMWKESEGQTPQGQTTLFGGTLTEQVTDPDNFLREWPVRQPTEKRFGLALEAQTEGLQPGFLLESLALPRGEDAREDVPPEGGRPDGPRMQTEWALPRVLLSDENPQALFLLPNPFVSTGAEVLAVRITALGTTSQSNPDQPGQSTTEPAGTPQAPSPAKQTLGKLQNQIQSAKDAEKPIDPEDLRGPLLYLATQSKGPLTQDLVLTATVDQWQSWLELVPSVDQLQANQWDWALERAAWVSQARLQVKGQLSRESRALLLRLAGEVGQYPSTMESAALQSADLETFQRRLVAENMTFLDDSNPGARVRAFDWLALRGHSVPNFDPLGTKQARRKAMRAFDAEQDSGEGDQ